MPDEEQEQQPMVASGDGNADDPYIGVDPIYKNYASDTEKPFTAEEGPDKELEEAALENEKVAFDAALALTPEGIKKTKDEEKAAAKADKADKGDNRSQMGESPPSSKPQMKSVQPKHES